MVLGEGADRDFPRTFREDPFGYALGAGGFGVAARRRSAAPYPSERSSVLADPEPNGKRVEPAL